MEELKRFMELSKLQFPTRRRKEKEEPQAEKDSKVETVKQDEDGTIIIAKMDIRPSSSGRERFGTGTKSWTKFPTETPALQRFSK